MTTTVSHPRPHRAKHEVQADGTVVVTYGAQGHEDWTVAYRDNREASIEASMQLFPGTSRAFLERAHSKRAYTKLRGKRR